MTIGLAARARRVLIRLLRRAGHSAAFRRPAHALVRAWNRGTFRRLGGHPGVAAVYARGSLVRGPFYPLASDVDLVVVARAAALADAAGARALLAALRHERRRNPSVRDWWQHLLHEGELPTVRANWALFATDEWRDAHGDMPWPVAAPADRARLVAAHWAQQRAWSASVVQPLVQPGAPFHVFDTGVRKCAFLAGRLRRIDAWNGPPLAPAELFALRRDHAHAFDASFRPPPATADARLAALAETLRELELGAQLVRSHLPRAAAEIAPAATGHARWPVELAALAATCCPGLVVGERTLHVVVDDGAGAAELGALVAALRRLPAFARPLTFLVPRAAADLWPLPCEAAPPVVFARDAPLARRLAAAAADVGLQRELRRYEALFLPCGARLALGFDDGAARLRRSAGSLATAVLLFAGDRIAGSRAEVVAAAHPASALADLAGELRACLADSDGDPPRLDADRLYALCEALAARLFAALARPAPAAAASVTAAIRA